MKTESIHFIFTTGLAVALGFSLASSTAIGYPTQAISYGSNPLWATGGDLNSSASVTIVVAPAEHDAVVTDIAIEIDTYGSVQCQLSDGTVVGKHRIKEEAGGVNRSLVSGIRVPAGQSLQLKHTGWGYPATYSVSGHYATR